MSAQAIPIIGQAWPEQGGIYIGKRLIDGQEHHIIAASLEQDIKGVEFANVDAAVAAIGEIDGHNDWHAGDQEDLMLAYVNAPDHFVRKGSDSIYWSRSEHHGFAWAVGFEDGRVGISNRGIKFRVRPFRRFIASSI